MKSIPAEALALIEQEQGTEPLIIVGIQWNTSGNETLYSDRTVTGVDGRILDINELEDILNLLNGASSLNIHIKLDDTDNFISNLMKTFDIHRCKVTIYLWYATLALSAKVPLFRGNVETPINWSEGERTVEFDVVSKVEDIEVGFTPESGQFGFVSPELVGNTWPLVFGTAVNVPATKISESPTGNLRESFGYVDQALYTKRDALRNRQSQLLALLTAISVLRGFIENIVAPAVQLRDNYLTTLIELNNLYREMLELQRKIIELNKRLENPNLTRAQKLAIQNEKIRTQVALNTVTNRISNYNGYKDVANYYLTLLDYEANMVNEALEKMNSILEELFTTQQSLIEVLSVIAEQERYVKQSVYIVNGHKFPQGSHVELLINGLVFGGTFNGDLFSINSGPSAPYRGISTRPVEDTINRVSVNSPASLDGMYALTTNGYIVQLSDRGDGQVEFTLQGRPTSDTQPNFTEDQSPVQVKQLSAQSQMIVNQLQYVDPQDINNLIEFDTFVQIEQSRGFPVAIIPGERYLFTNETLGDLAEVSPTILSSWLSQAQNPGDSSTFWFADVGTSVQLNGNPSIYVANILGGNVLNVTARRAINGVMRLSTVPTNYYTVSNVGSGDFDILLVTFPRALTTYSDEGWDEQIYISVTSSVGPQVTDVVRWIINTYTDDAIDETTFLAVADTLQNFPMHCVLHERKNLVSILQEIAWQSRCRIVFKQGTWYIYYMSAEPTPVKEITEDDITANTLKITLSQTDTLVTKFIANWKNDYSVDKPNKVILRHNINKYGTKEQNYDFWIYNNEEEVERSSTFWLIRYSNVWKIVEFETPLHMLELETGDAVTLNLNHPHIADTSVIGIVESVTFDSANYTCKFRVWTPVKAGTNTVYNLAFPSSVDVSTEFPTIDEIAAGNAGSGGPPSSSINGPIDSNLPSLYFSTRPRDFGTRNPADDNYSGPPNTLPGTAVGPNGGIPRNTTPNGPQGGVNVNPNNPFLPLRKNSNQNVWGAVVLQCIDNLTVQVQLNTGEIGVARWARAYEGAWQYPPQFSSVMVVRNVQGTMIAENFSNTDTLYLGTVMSITESGDLLVNVEITGENAEVVVNKPLIFVKGYISGDDAEVRPYGDDFTIEWLSEGFIKVSDKKDPHETVFYATMSQPYREGDPILLSKVFSTDVRLVDVNAEGRHWKPIQYIKATLKEDVTQDGDEPAYGEFELEYNDEKVKVKAYITKGLEDKIRKEQKYLKDKLKGILVLDEEVLSYRLIEQEGLAKYISFELTADLKIKDTEAKYALVDFQDGFAPDEDISKLYSWLKWEGDKGTKGYALLRNDGDYEIIQLDCPGD